MRAGAVVALLVGVVGVVGVVGPRAAAAPPPDAGGDTAGDAVDDDRAGDAVDDAVAVFDATLTERAGFAHIVHDGKVSVSGGDPVACATCHALDRQGRPRGRPGHAACFGACHGAAPAPAPRLRRGRAATPYRIAAEQAGVRRLPRARGAGPARRRRGRADRRVPAVRARSRLRPGDVPRRPRRGGDLRALPPATPGAAAATTGRAGRGGRGAPSPAPHDRCTGCHLAPAEARTRRR
ncbi:MAG: hypothetical protein H6709_02740 [Kofleriaceae bacterium]|nr:hypothetical protein [Kofleriaceae bacterium]